MHGPSFELIESGSIMRGELILMMDAFAIVIVVLSGLVCLQEFGIWRCARTVGWLRLGCLAAVFICAVALLAIGLL